MVSTLQALNIGFRKFVVSMYALPFASSFERRRKEARVAWFVRDIVIVFFLFLFFFYKCRLLKKSERDGQAQAGIIMPCPTLPRGGNEEIKNKNPSVYNPLDLLFKFVVRTCLKDIPSSGLQYTRVPNTEYRPSLSLTQKTSFVLYT